MIYAQESAWAEIIKVQLCSSCVRYKDRELCSALFVGSKTGRI